MQFFTILDLLILIRIFWEYPIPDHFSKYWLLPIIILIPIINWYKYVKPKKYIDYRKLWKDEHLIKKRKNGWRVIFYLGISLLIPLLYGLIRYNLMEGKGFLIQWNIWPHSQHHQTSIKQEQAIYKQYIIIAVGFTFRAKQRTGK